MHSDPVIMPSHKVQFLLCFLISYCNPFPSPFYGFPHFYHQFITWAFKKIIHTICELCIVIFKVFDTIRRHPRTFSVIVFSILFILCSILIIMFADFWLYIDFACLPVYWLPLLISLNLWLLLNVYCNYFNYQGKFWLIYNMASGQSL